MAAGKPEKYPFHASGLFPLHLYFVGDKAWVQSTYGPAAIPPGAEVVSVNGVPTAHLVRSLLPQLTFADGNAPNGKYEDLNRYFPGLYATFVGTAATYEVVYLTGEGEARAVLPAVTLADIEAYEQKRQPAARKPVRVQFLGEETALLSIDRFWIEKKNRTTPLSWRDLPATESPGHQELVIDLRNNEAARPVRDAALPLPAREPFRYYHRIGWRKRKKLGFSAWTPKIYHFARVLMVRKTDAGYDFKSRRRLKTGSRSGMPSGGTCTCSSTATVFR
jgi:hypothetical protein